MEKTLQFKHLEQLFGKLNPTDYEQIISIGELENVNIGSFLFKEGDADNALYIVLSGRLRVVKDLENNPKIVGDVAAGSAVGEFAFFTKEKRSASVYAIRKSEILKITEEAYERIVTIIPKIAYELPGIILERMQQQQGAGRLGAAPKNIALLKLQHDFNTEGLFPDIQKAFQDIGLVSDFFSEQITLHKEQNVFFEKIENSYSINLIECSKHNQEWAYQCMLYCDLVVVVSDFHANSDLYELENHLNLYQSPLTRRILLLVHQENAQQINNTESWLRNRKLDLHLHVRENNPRDLRRFCRIVANRAVGLTLGGGGAKGAAHVGAVKALMEAGLEFDFVGGTSAGALYGMGMTISDFNFETVFDFCQLGVEKRVTSRDYQFPFLSLMSGKNMRSFLQSMLGNAHLEDFFVSTFCVSTNYSNATSDMHNTGLARKKVEGSIAIPGIFPPVLIAGNLHIDGGVLDNLPIQAMLTKPVQHVVAISLSPQSSNTLELNEVPSAWALFLNIFKRKNKINMPKLPSILINSLTLNNARKGDTITNHVDLYLEIDLKEYGLLDWAKWKEIADKGYQFTKSYLQKVPAEEKFWK